MNRMVYLFSMGHFSVDWCQGAVPALLPYFIAQYGLSYQDAATLIFANMMVASVIQPVFGWLSDRVSMPWLIPLGPVLCGAGIFGISFCSSYETLFAAVMMSGLGSSLYHPEGALMVNRIAGAVRGRAMGTFSVGGNAGFAVGPALAGLCAYGLGIEWLFLFAAVNAALAAALFFCMPKAEAAAAETSRAEAKKRRGALRNRWGAFGKLSVTILARSVVFTTCNTFIPLYWIHVLGADEAAGSNALAILFTAGACITYGGGLLADRFSMRGIIRAAFFVMIPAMYFLTNSENITAATLLLLPVAVAVFMPYSPIVVLGQTYLAKNAGFASGVTLGLTTTLGGMIAPVIGWAADQWGLAAALQVLWAAGLIGFLAAMSLPKEETE